MKRYYCEGGTFGDYVWARDRAGARLLFFRRHNRMPVSVRRD
jgi:hypothetical protein